LQVTNSIAVPDHCGLVVLDMELDQSILHIGDERALFGVSMSPPPLPFSANRRGLKRVQGLRPSVDFLRGRLALLMDAAKTN
jgi:hypothetical protein